MNHDLTLFVLNFTGNTFELIYDHCRVSDITPAPKGSKFEKNIKLGLQNKNLGVAYWLLCLALPENSYINQNAIDEGLIKALSVLGVDHSLFLEEISVVASDMKNKLVSSEINSISTLAKAGFENFERIKTNGFKLDFYNLNVPPALLGDSENIDLFSSKNNQLKGFDIDVCFEELYKGQSWVERFHEACV